MPNRLAAHVPIGCLPSGVALYLLLSWPVAILLPEKAYVIALDTRASPSLAGHTVRKVFAFRDSGRLRHGQAVEQGRLTTRTGRLAATHAAVTKSDAEGRFSLVDLDPGSYHLIAKRNGYLETPYGAHRSGGNGTILRLDPGQNLYHLQLKLAPAAVIAGTVRDSDGELLEGAHVTLSRFTYEYGGSAEDENSTETDDRGEYRFSGLTAGKYYVGVR
jgi:Carboxypeptidase regulatory-like domain